MKREQSIYDDRRDFNLKMRLPHDGGDPVLLPDSVFSFIHGHLQEELDEMLDAHNRGDLLDFADSIVDLVYVALGGAMHSQLPFDELWDEVHQANMAKERCTGADDPRSKRGHSDDVVKPDGWEPPNIGAVLDRYELRRVGPTLGSSEPVDVGSLDIGDGVSGQHWIDQLLPRDQRFVDLARHIAGWSKDPTTKVGAVLVGTDRRDIAIGYNGFPPGIADTDERLGDHDTKLALTQHAERNVLDNASFDATGATLYTTFFVCSECAKSVVSRGIRKVICPPPAEHEPWATDAQWTRQLFQEAGIILYEIVD